MLKSDGGITPNVLNFLKHGPSKRHAGSPKSGIQNRKTGIGNAKSEARNPKSAVQALQPATLNVEHGTQNAERGTWNAERAAALHLRVAVAIICTLLLIPSIRAQGDDLTEEEANRVREAQELFPRTREYLTIAAARVTEIGRRTGKTYEIKVPGQKEKTPKKSKKGKGGKSSETEPENPLIFYSLPDLVHAISQSLRAVMTNVDERFQYKRAQPKEIARSLQLLQDFTSQNFSLLNDLEQKARQEEDELLYRAVRNVREDLERAQDGAREGLRVLQGPEDNSKPEDEPKKHH